jgi:hypothetical protein
MAEEELFDMLIPPGTPRSVISDVLKIYDVKLVTRKERLHYANMNGDLRELLAFRGPRPVIEEVEKFVFKKLEEYIGED